MFHNHGVTRPLQANVSHNRLILRLLFSLILTQGLEVPVKGVYVWLTLAELR